MTVIKWDFLFLFYKNHFSPVTRLRNDCIAVVFPPQKENEGLPGGVLVPLFPSKITLCSHVPTLSQNVFVL